MIHFNFYVNPQTTQFKAHFFQILRVSGDIFHGLNFGRLLYDPWFSKNLKILFVLRDPRGKEFSKLENGSLYDFTSFKLSRYNTMILVEK